MEHNCATVLVGYMCWWRFALGLGREGLFYNHRSRNDVVKITYMKLIPRGIVCNPLLNR